jgi:hypothetical protein
MLHNSFKVFITLLVVIIAAPVIDARELSATPLLDRLTGAWIGRAVHTPVGQLPYNINFEKVTESCVAGVAHNQASNHSWQFCAEPQNLTLRFLSDFRGNETPIHFTATARDTEVISLFAATHPFMQLQVSIQVDAVWIKVIHHGELHVEIRLERDKQ